MTTKLVRVALVSAVMLLGGCSSMEATEPVVAVSSSAAQRTGVEILADAREALTAAGSYRITIAGTEDGTEMGMDLRVAGDEFIGTLTLADATIRTLVVDGRAYIKPDAAGMVTIFGDGAKTVSGLAGDRWLLLPADGSAFGGTFTPAKVDDLLTPSGQAVMGPASEVGGIPATTVTDAPGNEFFVAAGREPNPLRIVGPQDSTVTFSEFGATFDEITAPPADEVLDTGKIPGQR